MHIDVHPNFEKDLDELWETNPRCAATLTVILEAIQDDPRALDKLTTYGEVQFGKNRVGVKNWKSIGVQRNIWRLRAFDSPATNYRAIYGYHYQTKQLCVLAVVNKDEFDYDDHDSDIVQRIINDWCVITS